MSKERISLSTDFQENNYTIEELNLPISISHVISKGEDCSDLHIHSDQYEIYVFLRGDIDYFAGNIRKHLVRVDALIVSPNELHRPYLIKETAYERVIIHVNQDVIKKLSTPVSNIYRFLEQYNCCFFHLPDEILNQFLNNERMIQQYYNTKNEFGSDILLETWLSITLIHLIQFLQKNQNKVNEGITVFPDFVKNAIQYVDDHYTENISVASISRYLNISSSHLNHLFKYYTGNTLWNYVISKRMLMAHKMILEQKSITEICYAVGFKNYSHFIKTFTKTFHVSPKKYEKEILTDRIV